MNGEGTLFNTHGVLDTPEQSAPRDPSEAVPSEYGVSDCKRQLACPQSEALAAARIIGISIALFVLVACGSPIKPPEGTFKSVTGGLHYACGVRSDGTIDCWGKRNRWEPIPQGRFLSVDAGIGGICGIRQDRSIACWQLEGIGTPFSGISPPRGKFKQVTTDVFGHSCAIRDDGAVVCWNSGGLGKPTPPTVVAEFGRLRSITGYGPVCGVRNDRSIACWGADFRGQSLFPPPGQFSSVTTGSRHACALRVDETIVCWGHSDDGQIAAPTGSFIAISAGSFHTCGIRTDRSIDCWGDAKDGKIEPPPGTFVSIHAGPFYTCAIKTDDTVECWGEK